MKKISILRPLSLAAAALMSATQIGAMNVDRCLGWLECASAEWQPVAGAVKYQVSYTGEGIADSVVDDPLVREYPDAIRVDVPGLKAGSYTLKIKAISASGAVIDETETEAIEVMPNLREGFAFIGGNVPGAYNMDGTLKEGARVLYVTANSVNTVTCGVCLKNGQAPVEHVGLANILSAYGKGIDKTPLAIRFIGTITDAEFSGLKDNNYINFQGNNNTEKLIENITLEGIGEDATLYGYGICFKRAHNIEIRNVGIMLFGDDAVSMDTDNTNIWLHNIDFFYGKPGSDSDQVKGDGSIDMKYYSTFVTISYNHFFDSGKVMGCGGATGEKKGNLSITFHHNWFDHADSRCPRLHYTTAHVYNNYYDGVSVYGIGNTSETSAFIESNYFRNVRRPMMISGQGTDKYDEANGTYTLKGTFSGQPGGMTKAFDNIFAEVTPKFVTQNQHSTQFDAYAVTERDEIIPETVVSVNGAWKYSNFDTAYDMYVSVPDATSKVPEIVTANAGRMNGGDFKWKFDNGVDDADHDVNQPLKSAILTYKSSLRAVQGETEFSMSGVAEITSDNNAATEIYNLQGIRLTQSIKDLPNGTYILRTAKESKKVVK